MRIAIATLLSLMAFSCSKAPASKPDSAPVPEPSAPQFMIKQGFRDLKWNDPPTKDMKTIGEGNELFERPADKLAIGDAKLKLINYLFFENRFRSVIVHLDSENEGTLLNSLRAQWGQGEEMPDGRIVWAPDPKDPLQTVAGFAPSSSHKVEDGSAVFQIYSMTILKEMKESQGKKAKGDL